jgi:hypothetical protein
MHPALRDGDIVVGVRRVPQVGAIVVAKQGNREVIKRVRHIDGDKVYLVGDNSQDSTDSRHYGNINKSAILGTIMMILPKATNPPKPVKTYGVLLGRIAAAVLVAMALIHLFRIDTLIPILDDALPGGGVAASIVALIIVFSEVFAVPFALRMKLSPLAHIISGALVAFAPLWWVLIGIWTLGISDTTGQLGSFVIVPSVGWVLALNILWVAFNYFALYTLGYNRLSVKQLLNK